MAQTKIQNDVFKMSSNPCGYCVIINIINFDEDDQMERSDSIKSVNLIRETFNNLNFKVKMFQDLNESQIMLTLNDLMNKEECDSHECFLLYIHSHGKENGFITANNKVFNFHDILMLFTNTNCKKFIGKPKLVFFDCCRGEHYSTDFSDFDFTKNDFANPDGALFSDLHICFSTLDSKSIIKN